MHYDRHLALKDKSSISVWYTVTQTDIGEDVEYSVEFSCKGVTGLGKDAGDVRCKFLMMTDPIKPSDQFTTPKLKMDTRGDLSDHSPKADKNYASSFSWKTPKIPSSPYGGAANGETTPVPFVFDELTIGEQLFSLALGFGCQAGVKKGECSIDKLPGVKEAADKMKAMILKENMPKTAALIGKLEAQTNEENGVSLAYSRIKMLREEYPEIEDEMRQLASSSSSSDGLLELELRTTGDSSLGDAHALLSKMSASTLGLLSAKRSYLDDVWKDECRNCKCLGSCQPGDC